MRAQKNGFDIRFFFKPQKPVAYRSVKVGVAGHDFSELLTEEDRKIVSEEWKALKSRKGYRTYSRPGGVGSLHAASSGKFTFRPTEFRVSSSAYLTYPCRTMSAKVYDQMRVSAVACMVVLGDGRFVVQKRSGNVSLGEGLLDSSAAGYAKIRGKTIDFEAAAFEKLGRELGIREKMVKSIRLAAVHNSGSDCSGTFDFIVKTTLTGEQVLAAADPHYVSGLEFVRPEDLPGFIFLHFVEKKDIVPEGCAAMLACLPHAHFLAECAKLSRAGKKIAFGSLRAGEFMPAKKQPFRTGKSRGRPAAEIKD